MTEDEAKKKWCPMSRSLYGDGVTCATSANRNDDGGVFEADMCIASGCMMWRWDQVKNPKWHPASGFSVPAPHPADVEPPFVDSTTHGRCGLAR